MKIFITGASGFVGSHFLRELLRSSDYEVAILVRESSDFSRINDSLTRCRLIRGSLRDPNSYVSELKNFSPDVVVHLAWDGVKNYDRNSVAQWKNIPDFFNLIEAAQLCNVKKIIGLGSQAEYGQCKNLVDESHPTNPTTLYGKTKFVAGSLGLEICESYGIDLIWLRLFSSYGPDDHPSWMIPYLIQTLLQGNRPALTKGDQLWDYINIKDVVSAILAAIKTKMPSGSYNLGSGSVIKIRVLAEMIRDLINAELELGFGEVPYRHDQVMHLQADISKLSNATDWKPKVGIAEGILDTVSFYRGSLSK